MPNKAENLPPRLRPLGAVYLQDQTAGCETYDDDYPLPHSLLLLAQGNLTTVEQLHRRWRESVFESLKHQVY